MSALELVVAFNERCIEGRSRQDIVPAFEMCADLMIICNFRRAFPYAKGLETQALSKGWSKENVRELHSARSPKISLQSRPGLRAVLKWSNRPGLGSLSASTDGVAVCVQTIQSGRQSHCC